MRMIYGPRVPKRAEIEGYWCGMRDASEIFQRMAADIEVVRPINLFLEEFGELKMRKTFQQWRNKLRIDEIKHIGVFNFPLDDETDFDWEDYWMRKHMLIDRKNPPPLRQNTKEAPE